MLSGILIFLLLTVAIGFGFSTLRQMSADERWAAIKYLSYALSCGIIALVVLAFVVFIF